MLAEMILAGEESWMASAVSVHAGVDGLIVGDRVGALEPAQAG